MPRLPLCAILEPNLPLDTSSSCSMLPKEHNGVVDPELKVYGTNNIRVVDLSVVPLQFAAHPMCELGTSLIDRDAAD